MPLPADAERRGALIPALGRALMPSTAGVTALLVDLARVRARARGGARRRAGGNGRARARSRRRRRRSRAPGRRPVLRRRRTTPLRCSAMIGANGHGDARSRLVRAKQRLDTTRLVAAARADRRRASRRRAVALPLTPVAALRRLRHASRHLPASRRRLHDLVTHELCHVWQMQHRPLAMPLRYLRTGYARSPYERQARAAAGGRTGLFSAVEREPGRGAEGSSAKTIAISVPASLALTTVWRAVSRSMMSSP